MRVPCCRSQYRGVARHHRANGEQILFGQRRCCTYPTILLFGVLNGVASTLITASASRPARRLFSISCSANYGRDPRQRTQETPTHTIIVAARPVSASSSSRTPSSCPIGAIDSWSDRRDFSGDHVRARQ